MTEFAEAETPSPGEDWAGADDDGRRKKIEDSLSEIEPAPPVRVTRARSNGQIYLELLEDLPARDRGVMLRDLEFQIKKNVDAALILWCEPIGDRNALRKLRGIEISSI